MPAWRMHVLITNQWDQQLVLQASIKQEKCQVVNIWQEKCTTAHVLGSVRATCSPGVICTGEPSALMKICAITYFSGQ